MDRTETLLATRSAFSETATRITDIIRAQADLTAPLGGGSGWTAREAAAHLSLTPHLVRDLGSGAISPYGSLDPPACAATNEQRFGDIAETDPHKLADLMLDAVGLMLADTEGRPGDQLVSWHCGGQIDLADLTGVGLGEYLLHGYDITEALGVPWPIDPEHATLLFGSYLAVAETLTNPVTTAGHSAGYEITVRGGPAHTVRFIDGVLSLEPSGGTVDCEISVDPVAFLLAFSGRMSRWQAISLGLIAAAGERPELALGFSDLFLFP